MTILVAAKGGDGTIYVASDTLITDDTSGRTGYRKKFIWGPAGRLILVAGYMRAINIFNVVPEVFDVPDNSAPDLDAFITAENMARILFEHGYVRGNNNSGEAEPTCISGEFMYITQGQIFAIDSSLSIDPYEEHVAAGSGYKFAQGALHSLRTAHPLTKVLRAAEAACEYEPSCGGPLDLNIITPLKLTEKKSDAFIKKAFKEAGLEDYTNNLTVYLRSFA